MPYKAKNGSDVPLFKQLNAHQVIHGDCLQCKCCGPCCGMCCGQCPCDYGCLECDMSCLIGLCAPCRGACKPACDAVLNCEKACQAKIPAMFDCGPECGCKTVGGELTCGVAALEGLVGVWHVGNSMYPEMLPSILFPCCCFSPNIPLPVGEDNQKSGDNWSIGSGGAEKIKPCKAVCGEACVMLPCCNLHATLATSPHCGLCMDPIFNGNEPKWFTKAFKMPYVKFV